MTAATARQIATEPLPMQQIMPHGTWYIARTAPSLVADLVRQCHRLGVQAYYPCYARRVGSKHRKSGEPQWSYPPAFPGYVFFPRQQIQHGELDGLPDHIRNRFRFLTMGQRYCEIWPKTIETIMENEREWMRTAPEPRAIERFEVGQTVRVRGDLWPPAKVVEIKNATVVVASEFANIEVDPMLLEPVA